MNKIWIRIKNSLNNNDWIIGGDREICTKRKKEEKKIDALYESNKKAILVDE